MTDDQKIVISSNEEKNFDKQIRPNLFDDFIGQSSIVKSLKTYITAAKQREEALDHILLYGPPGLGKTTLSNIIATELEKGFLSTSGPVISIPGDLSGMLTNLQERDVFFKNVFNREIFTLFILFNSHIINFVYFKRLYFGFNCYFSFSLFWKGNN